MHEGNRVDYDCWMFGREDDIIVAELCLSCGGVAERVKNALKQLQLFNIAVSNLAYRLSCAKVSAHVLETTNKYFFVAEQSSCTNIEKMAAVRRPLYLQNKFWLWKSKSKVSKQCSLCLIAHIISF